MSLRPLNRDPRYMSGDYASMFNIPVHQSNANFASNPYKPGTCQPEDIVNFSLTQGGLPCNPDRSNVTVWRTTGELSKLSVTTAAAVAAAATRR